MENIQATKSKSKYVINERYINLPHIIGVLPELGKDLKPTGKYKRVNLLGKDIILSKPATPQNPKQDDVKVQAATEADLEVLYNQGMTDVIDKV